ncbi:MAG: CBS domain-containing protein [Chloroflexi bacterium]|nr:CBS domain-containing protein [Chloroflexota bacterium]
MARATYYYLSQLLDKPVLDPTGKPVGEVADLIVRLGGPFPPITGVAVRLGGGGRRISPWASFLHWSQVEAVSTEGIRLKTAQLDIRAFRRRPGEMLLKVDLLDQQVIDLNGRKVVRVNDVQLVAAGLQGVDLRLAGIDVGTRGLLRRLELDRLAAWLSRRLPRLVSDRVIPWESIEPVDLTELPSEEQAWGERQALVNGRSGGGRGVQLTHERLAMLHPADVADLVEKLSAPERNAILESLNAEMAAEAIGELDPDMRADVLEGLPTKAAQEILAELPPDEAADALAEVSGERAEELLGGLSAEDADEVRELMAYPEGVAGSMMNTDYVALADDLTAQQTIDRLRELAPPAEEIYYIYVVAKSGVLLGVLSLRDLIVAKPQTRLSELIRARGKVVRVPDDLPVDEVVRVIDKYNLLAVPVTDEADRLVGVVTIDDALAAVAPDEEEEAGWWRARLRR